MQCEGGESENEVDESVSSASHWQYLAGLKPSPRGLVFYQGCVSRQAFSWSWHEGHQYLNTGHGKAVDKSDVTAITPQ